MKNKYYLEQLKKLQNTDDYEVAHSDADSILTELLKELGYGDIVREYEKIHKWYA